MRRILLAVLLVVVLSLAANPIQAQKNADTEKAILALEQKWLDLELSGQVDQLTTLLADTWVTTDPDGKVFDRAGFIADEKNYHFTSSVYTDEKVFVYGNTVIAIGSTKFKGTGPGGKAVEGTIRWTDTWVKMPNGKWMCVASQLTNVKL